MNRLPMALVLGVGLSLMPSCARRDAKVAWDTNDMEREIAAELRKFEGLRSDFGRMEVLAWRTEERTVRPIPLARDRFTVALVWAQTAGAVRRWALIEMFNRWTGDDKSWHRSLFWREVRFPLTHPRPGETRDGTWHAYAHYDHPPSSREICDFAAVSFLDPNRGEYEVVAGAFRIQTWLNVVGDEPACHLGADIPH
jgi:hypothetical protein